MYKVIGYFGDQVFSNGKLYTTSKEAEIIAKQLNETVERNGFPIEYKVKPISPFNRVNKNECYYHIARTGEVDVETDMDFPFDRRMHSVANYCTDKDMIQQRAYMEMLSRLLWRYSMEHNGNEIDWSDNEMKHYIYHTSEGKWGTSMDCWIKGTGVYFASEEIAQSAITEIVIPFMEKHPDFKF